MLFASFLDLLPVYFISLWIFLSSIFIIALLKADNSIMDIAYGPSFAVAAWSTVLWSGTFEPLALIVAGCITLWAGRLSTRIWRKNHGKPEDARYAAWREAWSERGRWYFILRSYLQVYMLQGVIIAIVGLPALVATAYAADINYWFMALGAFVFASGLAYETIADRQLDRWLARKQRGETDVDLMQEGLFRYSRRPNYFGEVTIWVGLMLIVLPLPFGWLAIASPLLIWYIVTYVTGPMLENIFLEKFPEQYQAYIDTTNYLVPGPVRSPKEQTS